MSFPVSAQPVSPPILPVQQASAFNPEVAFLLARCANGSRIERPERIRQIRLLDWRHLIDLAEHHGVIPQLHRSLQAFGEVAVPDSLRQSHENNARQTLSLTRELLHVLEKLESHGIAALPYKGPVLAELLYGNITMRQFSDLDLLIRSSDLPRVKSALAELGYQPSLELTQREEREYIKSGYEHTFDCAQGRNLVEVQWRMLPRFYAIDFDIDGFFERAVPFTLLGGGSRTLCAEDLVLVLCVHAAKHAWQQLSWLCDIAELTRSRQIDWDVIQEEAKLLGIQRILAVTFFLTHKLIEMPLPSFVEARLQNDASIEHLANELIPKLVSGNDYDTESFSYFRLMIRVRERWQDRVKFLWRLIFTPSIGEWSAIRLPSPLFSLYPVVRMFRLMSRFFF